MHISKKNFIIFFSILIFTICIGKNVLASDIENNYKITMKRDLLTLMMAYPEYIEGVERKNDKVYLVTKGGQYILYDDKIKKSHMEKLNNPDIQDMLEDIYPLESINELLDKDFDPGRARIYPLLHEVYGKSKGEVESNLVSVRTGYQNNRFNKNNNAAKSLKKVMKEVEEASKTNKNIYSFISPTNGTFNYRYISGTGKLSAHAFGIAIDLASDRRDYWKWATRKDGNDRIKSYSKELVKIFENNNFIWGGKWGHFDILHFEYRPEIIMKAKYFSQKPKSNEPWYKGVNLNDSNIKKYIEKIDKGVN